MKIVCLEGDQSTLGVGDAGVIVYEVNRVLTALYNFFINFFLGKLVTHSSFLVVASQAKELLESVPEIHFLGRRPSLRLR